MAKTDGTDNASDSRAAEPESRQGGLAGEVIDAFEHLGDSKAAKKAAKSAKKDEKKRAKKAKKECKQVCKAGVTAEAVAAAAAQGSAHAADSGEEYRITPTKARNAVSVAKIVVPAAVPVLAPIAVRTAGSAREAFDRYRARKLGVDVERLGEYAGYGAGLHARIAGASDGLTSLREAGNAAPGESSGESNVAFAEQKQDTLRQLSATVRAAERMPTVRRKAAHRAVAGELDQIETELLDRLGA